MDFMVPASVLFFCSLWTKYDSSSTTENTTVDAASKQVILQRNWWHFPTPADFSGESLPSLNLDKFKYQIINLTRFKDVPCFSWGGKQHLQAWPVCIIWVSCQNMSPSLFSTFFLSSLQFVWCKWSSTIFRWNRFFFEMKGLFGVNLYMSCGAHPGEGSPLNVWGSRTRRSPLVLGRGFASPYIYILYIYIHIYMYWGVYGTQ